MHPGDKILTRMIYEEFKENRLAKHPLEYEMHDSDEENKTKGRDINKE